MPTRFFANNRFDSAHNKMHTRHKNTILVPVLTRSECVQLNIILTDDFCTCHICFHAFIQYVKTEWPKPTLVPCSFPNILRITLASATACCCIRLCWLRHGKPHVKLCDPVLQRVDGNNDKNTTCSGVTQEDIDERDHL